MKIDVHTLDFIKRAAATASKVGIQQLLIEKSAISGVDENKTVVLLHEDKIPTLPFETLVLPQISTFLSRYAIVEGQDDVDIEANVDNSGMVRSLLMKSKSVKVDYRCASPTTMSPKPPKSLKDTMAYMVKLNAEAVMLLAKAQAAMGSETVTIISDKSGVSFEMYDVNSDQFSHTFNSKVEALQDDNTEFKFTYPLKTVLPLFKENAEGFFYVGTKGVMSIDYQNLTLFIIPRAE